MSFLVPHKTNLAAKLRSLPVLKYITTHCRRSASAVESQGVSMEGEEDNLARAKKRLKQSPSPSKDLTKLASLAASSGRA